MPSVSDFETYLAGLVSETKALADAHPESALTSARKTAESICRELYQGKFGDPGKAMLDEMLKKLVAAKVIPTRVAVPFGTIQAYGNFGTHAQGDHARADRSYVAPCLAALDEVVAWYYRDVLQKEPPGGAAAPPRGKSPVIAATAALVLAGGIGAVFFVRGSSHQATQETVSTPAVLPPAPPPTVEAPPPVVVAASAEPPIAPSAGPQPPIGVDLTVHATVGGVSRTLAAGDQLRKGDSIAFEVRPSADAYVYIAQRSNGRLDVLFPDPEINVTNPLPAGKSVRIPPGDTFTLDEKDLGPQDLFVIASRHEIPQLATALASARVQDGAKPADVQAAQRDAQDALAQTAKRDDCGARAFHLTGKDDPCRMLKRGLVLTSKIDAQKKQPSISFQSDPGDDTLVGTFGYEHAP
jgi:hypothetical protein